MLRPSERWYWTYCPTKDRLLLDISDEAQFCSPFTGAQLLQQPKHQPLAMAEAEMFWAVDASLQQLELPVSERLELCLTALCAPFIQLQAHKSWYFQQAEHNDAALFELVTLRGLSTQYALVLGAESHSVNCLLLGDISTLAGKSLPRLQLVRVLRNRISRINASSAYRHSA
jgi:cell division protein ZapC